MKVGKKCAEKWAESAVLTVCKLLISGRNPNTALSAHFFTFRQEPYVCYQHGV